MQEFILNLPLIGPKFIDVVLFSDMAKIYTGIYIFLVETTKFSRAEKNSTFGLLLLRGFLSRAVVSSSATVSEESVVQLSGRRRVDKYTPHEAPLSLMVNVESVIDVSKSRPF